MTVPLVLGLVACGSSQASSTGPSVEPTASSARSGASACPTSMAIAKEGSGVCLDLTLVTVSAYDECAAKGACGKPATLYPSCNGNFRDRGNHPINCVTWSDANSFCHWAGKRLPSYEELRAAAAGPSGAAWPWGPQPPTDQICWSVGGQREGTCPVGSYPKSNGVRGHADMVGNLWQWTSTLVTELDPKSKPDEAVVYTALDWTSDASSTGSYTSAEKSVALWSIGFRCAR
ncbi:MAG: SUMF1/EgtB/PvdO family nonheme iron enzyme [Polyangiaceae bacterium]